MKDILIKEAMIPISDYTTIKEDAVLHDVFQLIETNKQDIKHHTHRDVIVVDKMGAFIGKLTMLDVFRALEPNYKKMSGYKDGFLTKEFVLNAAKEYDLWREPIKDLCERGSLIKVSEIMHIPEKNEFVQESDTLEKALHAYVMGGHQPLIVKNNEAVTGILRFEDLYEVIRKNMLSCPIPS